MSQKLIAAASAAIVALGAAPAATNLPLGTTNNLTSSELQELLKEHFSQLEKVGGATAIQIAGRMPGEGL